MSTPNIALLAVRAAGNEGIKYFQPGGIAFNLTAMLMGLLLGGLLACILAVLFHGLVGRFFRTLISFRAHSRESSRTLAELGFSKNLMLRRALRSRHSLVRKLVTVVLPDGTILTPLHSADDDLADAEAAASAIHAEDHPIVRAEEGKDTDEARAAEAAKAAEAAESTVATTAEATAEATTEATAEAPTEAPTAEAPKPAAEPTTAPTATLPPQPLAPEPAFDPDAATYFLDDRHRRRAEIRFSGRGNDARFLIPAVIVFVILAATLPIYMPYFVELFDAVIARILGA